MYSAYSIAWHKIKILEVLILFIYLFNEFAQRQVIIQLGPVVRKPINANRRLKIYQGVYFSTPKCCTTLIFGKSLH